MVPGSRGIRKEDLIDYPLPSKVERRDFSMEQGKKREPPLTSSKIIVRCEMSGVRMSTRAIIVRQLRSACSGTTGDQTAEALSDLREVYGRAKCDPHTDEIADQEASQFGREAGRVFATAPGTGAKGKICADSRADR